MLIESVETCIVEQQLEKPFYFSQWEYDSRQVCLVKVIAKDGTYGFAAELHLTSNLDVIPGRMREPEPILEMDRTENPLRDVLTVPMFQAVDGLVDVPDSAGLGVDVNPQVLKEFSAITT
jgi:L-alanine-DL-glutamate epimerase-like enolase superfamily enzyme